jgi:D-alanine-D-alanine ligase
VLNEPNTVPGSFAYYLFEPIGMPFDALVDELVGIAIAEDREARATTRVFESSLLAKHTSGA